MNRSVALSVFASLGLAASFLACSGKIEEPSGVTPAITEAGAPTPRREAGVATPDPDPPLRDVNAPLVVDLGMVAAGQTVTLNVPAGALGFNIVVESTTDPSAFVGIERITSPTGEVVHDAYTPKGGDHATSESSFGSIASASVPQSEAKAANRPEAGKWTIRIGGGSPLEPPPPPPPLDGGGGGGGGTDSGTTSPSATFHVEARIQIGHSTGFVGGRLDMRVFIPTGLKLDGKIVDPTTAATHAGIERRLDTFYKALSNNVGIDRGAVTFLAAKAQLQFVDDESTLLDAFSVSSGRPDEQALNLLLTNGIDFGDGNGAWGIAPGIPGAASRSGTPMSGIILAIGDTPAIGDGLTILHEAGHFIGLNHTTEFYGGYADPLGDTPKCADLSMDDPGTISDCPDRTNIMFPAFYGAAGSAIDVSEAQKAVYRGSPFYKAYKEPVVGMGTMSQRIPLGLGDHERITLTKSGRALTPVETWLSMSLCAHASHAKLDASAFALAKGRAPTIAALRAAAVDTDLPDVMRRKARGALRSLGASVQ